MERVCKNLKRLLLVVIASFTLGYSYAQVTVTGTILDGNTKEPLIGVNVVEIGTTNGTVTDFDGKYSIKVASTSSSIEFSYIGYVNQTIKVGSQTVINLTLKENTRELTEVVKIGYGQQKKEDVTAAITSLRDEDIKGKPVLSVDQALTGKAAGVRIQSNSGTPGGEVSVQIRGIASLKNSDPLYIVDGVPTTSIKSINTSDIASISILKDASACAIYGARGANGVIIVTTKSGKQGGSGKIQESITVDFSSYMGVQNAWKKVDVLNASEYIDYYNELAGETVYFVENDTIWKNSNGGVKMQHPDANGTDWQDEIMRSAIIKNYYVSVSGGGEKSNFSTSIGQFEQEGIVKNTDYKRLTTGIKGEHRIGKRIRVEESIGYNTSKQSRIDDGSMWNNVLTAAIVMPPIIPVTDEVNYKGNPRNPNYYASEEASNPVVRINEYGDYTEGYGLGGHFSVELDLLKGLTFRTLASSSMWGETREKYSNDFEVSSLLSSTRNLEVQSSQGNNSNYTNTLTYSKTLYAKKDDGSRDSTKMRHAFNVIAGAEKFKEHQELYSITGSRLYSNDENLRYVTLSDSTSVTVDPTWQGVREYTMASYFGRFEYNFLNKYNINISVRRDGSSKFGENKKWDWFPAIGGAWKVSKENFFKNNESLKFINNFKIRGGWGKIGNSAAADPYGWASLMDQTTPYNFGGTQVVGASALTPQNKSVKWEASETYNAGVDLEFFKGKLAFTADYFYKQTEDMLLKAPVPSVAGVNDAPITNEGSMLNKGWEFSLSYTKSDGKFHYSVSGNIALIDNEITYMGGTEFEPAEQPAGYIDVGSYYSVVNAEGHDVGSFYGFYVDPNDPVYTSWADINSSPTPKQSVLAPGDAKFVDINKDGVVDDDDMTYIGSPIADFVYGLTINADYKGFDFSCTFAGSQGNDIYNAVDAWACADVQGFNQTSSKLDAWTEDNTDTDVPRAVRSNQNYNYSSSLYIEDGSYLRMKDITIGYSIPDKLVSKIKLSKLRIYVQAQNLLTLTNYTGADPEVGNNPSQGYDANGAKGFELGIDRGTYPQSRTFLLGVNLSF